jgi:hypothetical protein
VPTVPSSPQRPSFFYLPGKSLRIFPASSRPDLEEATGLQEIGLPQKAQGELPQREKIPEDSLRAQEVSSPFLGVSRELKRAQYFQDPGSDSLLEGSLTFSAGRQIIRRATEFEQG